MIVGMGKSGVASLDAISSFGADVSVYDAADIEWDAPKVFHKLKELGTPSYFNGKEPASEGWDYIILSPGVPTDIPFLKDAVANGAMLIGELELAYRLGNGRFAAITGTNGKTTTTSLTGVIFSKSGLDSAVAGNIGVPVTKKAMRAGDDTWLVT
jgi:UDP-N-acetylmuramoylalanine--D-glutamate ligase